ncbi:hypothetical protein [Hymenobacter sp. HDW8]|uniref:hypothetical protein n=1 Tax=Hymenobacter sp. HDW8 TaxID=2714932 RepID=UPI0014074031|nr:hypothetical protein [Hymenobacter sp. HDW8]QIL78353.1 hypothetical protein G7064_21295 [Hymenobacter sp. HDW8]
MHNPVGIFAVEDAFHLTRRGWVLVGEVTGQVDPGNWLVFEPEVTLVVTSVEAINKQGVHKTGLLVSPHLASRYELPGQQLIGNTAQIMR